jgi:hypothetical protein
MLCVSSASTMSIEACAVGCATACIVRGVGDTEPNIALQEMTTDLSGSFGTIIPVLHQALPRGCLRAALSLSLDSHSHRAVPWGGLGVVRHHPGPRLAPSRGQQRAEPPGGTNARRAVSPEPRGDREVLPGGAGRAGGALLPAASARVCRGASADAQRGGQVRVSVPRCQC